MPSSPCHSTPLLCYSHSVLVKTIGWPVTVILSLCWEGACPLSLGVLLSQLLLLEFAGSLVEAAGFLQTELLSAARICCLSILQEPRQFKGIYKGSGSRGTSRIRGKMGQGRGEVQSQVAIGRAVGLRMGRSTWGRTCRQAGELEGQRGTSSETGGWEIGSPREKEVLTLQSAPQGQANPTALLCFFLTIDFKCSHL